MLMKLRIPFFIVLAAGVAFFTFKAESQRTEAVLERQKQDNNAIQAEFDAELGKIQDALDEEKITPEEASDLRQEAHEKLSAQGQEAMERSMNGAG